MTAGIKCQVSRSARIIIHELAISLVAMSHDYNSQSLMHFIISLYYIKNLLKKFHKKGDFSMLAQK